MPAKNNSQLKIKHGIVVFVTVISVLFVAVSYLAYPPEPQFEHVPSLTTPEQVSYLLLDDN